MREGELLVFGAHYGPMPLDFGKWPLTRAWTNGRAVLDRKPIHVHDLQAEKIEFPDVHAMAQRMGHRTILSIPLLRGEEAIGSLTVRRTEIRPFSAKQIELAETFADQAVIGIENVRLFNETREALERQTATADILKVIASSPSDVQPVFEAVATSANRLFGGFSTAVFRFVGNLIHLAAFTPTNPAADEVLKASFPRRPADFPPFEWVRDGETAQVVHTESESSVRDIARARGYRSLLLSPLMSSGAPIGVISVPRKEPCPVDAHQVQLLQTF